MGRQSENGAESGFRVIARWVSATSIATICGQFGGDIDIGAART
jgi:hypothetical protein